MHRLAVEQLEDAAYFSCHKVENACECVNFPSIKLAARENVRIGCFDVRWTP